MIGIQEQSDIFALIGRTLERKITCFAVGGTAMMYLGFKSATKDADLVFLNKEDQTVFRDALLELGFSYSNPRHVYVKTLFPAMALSRGGEFLFDLFVKQIVHFELSDRIAQRTKQTQEFVNLVLHIPREEDIIVLKCATDREGDLFDAKTIAEGKNLDWNLVGEEIIAQATKPEYHYAPSRLHEFLSRLEEKYQVIIPKSVFERLELWMAENPKPETQ